MPQLNRDKDSLYPPGKLNLWFLATSGVLVAAIVWMLADDYVRSWKSVQRAFFERQAGLLAVQKEIQEGDIRDDEALAAKLKDVGAKIAQARAALEVKDVAQQIAKLEADLAEQKILVAEADTAIKAIKGKLSERRFAYEMALQSGKTEKASEIQERVNELSGEQDAADCTRQREVVTQEQLEAKLAAIREPLRVLEAERATLLGHIAKTTIALDDSIARTEKNQWRNLPIADFLTPSIKIEKVVLESIHDNFNFATSPKVDECITCHKGIDREIMSEPVVSRLLTGYLRARFGEKAWKKLEVEPQWVAASTPGKLKPWLSGSPSLLDVFPKAALEAALAGGEKDKAAQDALVGKWRDRVLGGKSLEVGGRDLLAPFAIRPVEWAHPHLEFMVGPKSPHKLENVGCTVCHAGVGRRLDFVRATHTPADKAQEHTWVKEYGWKVDPLVDYPMLPLHYVEGQCLKCHQPALAYKPVPEPLKRFEPKLKPDGEIERDTMGEVVLTSTRLKAPQPVNGTRSEAEGRWHADVVEHGTNVMREVGCQGCHAIKDFGLHVGYPRKLDLQRGFDHSTPAPGALTAAGAPKVGPDISHLKDKTTREWTMRWLENPNAFKIDTRMPSFYRHRLHDDAYRVLLGADGKPQDPTVVVNPVTRDLAQIDVEMLAITTYLFDGQKGTRAAEYAEPPAGDPENGRKIFYSSANCYACHVGPEDVKEQSDLPEATKRRFADREDLPPGPRITTIGSKVNAKWLFAWLKEPRHYNSVTRMPNNRLRDQTAADGKTVTRTADQQYADLVAYLLQFKDKEFDARELPDPAKGVRWTEEHKFLLSDMWQEWYGKKSATGSRSVEEGAKVASEMMASNLSGMLSEVGFGLVRHRGCFGCHNVQGLEAQQPIGKELTKEGSQDLHKFDFGILGHDEVEHRRWDWIHNKILSPRIYDKGRHKPRFVDKLRMPLFNFREVDRTAVVAVVLGLVDEPIKPAAKYAPTEAMKKVAAGRAVIERYGCGQCHTIENRTGVLTAEQLDRGMELWMLPPNLYGEGNRTKADWLFKFLKAPFDVRPNPIQRMPMFRLSDEETAALVDYFQVVAQRRDRLGTDPEDAPLDATPYPEPVKIVVKGKDEKGEPLDREFVVNNQIEEAKALFTTANCVKCHLPKGTPGADPNEGASAPPFTMAQARLRRDWMFDMIHEPQWQIQGTKMPAFWPMKAKRSQKEGDTRRVEFPQFQPLVRGQKTFTPDQLAEAQMGAIVRYILWHYEMPTFAPASPPDATGK